MLQMKRECEFLNENQNNNNISNNIKNNQNKHKNNERILNNLNALNDDNNSNTYNNNNFTNNINFKNSKLFITSRIFTYIKRKRRDIITSEITTENTYNNSKMDATTRTMHTATTTTDETERSSTHHHHQQQQQQQQEQQSSVSCCLLCRCEFTNQYCSCHVAGESAQTLSAPAMRTASKNNLSSSPTTTITTTLRSTLPGLATIATGDALIHNNNNTKTSPSTNNFNNKNNFSYNLNVNNNNTNNNSNNLNNSENNNNYYSEIRRIYHLLDYINSLKRIIMLLLVTIQIMIMNSFTSYKHKILKKSSSSKNTISRAYFLMLFMSLLLIMNSTIMSATFVHGSQVSPATTPETKGETGICQSMDIRNKPEFIKNLANCRVVEGFVQIILIDKYLESDYANLTFPLLTEITDYLLLYRVNGLLTLSKLFPNLTVIRGNVLFSDYALIIYEMSHLQEIGLVSLQYIGRGAIRVEKNPKLCHVEDIDWSYICKDTLQKDHFIADNCKDNSCPICPGTFKNDRRVYNSQDHKNKSNSFKCPTLKHDPHKTLCWNVDNCQKICPEKCGNRSCTDRAECCHESCLGGCTGPKLDNCTVCRKFSWFNKESLSCRESCPDGTFVHMERRCITAAECRKIPRPLDGIEGIDFPYMPFQGKCVIDCPPDHAKVGSGNNRTCEKCSSGSCRKVCEGANIESYDSIKQMRGCTHIQGSLEIQIKTQSGLNIVRELENSMSSIEEIDGYLKIVRSYPLLSLNFLKRLRVIKGNDLDSKKNSLTVLDNQNLQSLWDPSHNITILNGHLFFHFNPKLCFSKIEELKNMSGPNVEIATIDSARLSNGDRVSCNIVQLNVTVSSINSNSAVLNWKPLLLDDQRKLLGYMVYYINAPYRNVTLLDGRDACATDGWQVDDATDFDESSASFFLTQLEAYSQYAFYVKTLTISSVGLGAQSEIQYIRTEPAQPENVLRLRQGYSNSSNEVTVYWDRPKKVNGNLTSYIIKADLMPENLNILSIRDYCADPIDDVQKEPEIEITPKKPEPPPESTGQCDCSDCPYNRQGNKPLDEDEAIDRNSFEDQLQNWAYVKKPAAKSPEETRTKRSALMAMSHDTSSNQIPVLFPTNVNKTDNSDMKEEMKVSIMNGSYYQYIYENVSSSVTQITLKKLKHFSTYRLTVRACREGTGDNCSSEAILIIKTRAIADADIIRNYTIKKETTNHTSNTAHIQWAKPADPNGIIVSYTIKFQQVDVPDAKPQFKCVKLKTHESQNGVYLLNGLNPGNYSIQISATSLYKDSDYTPVQYVFISKQSEGGLSSTAITMCAIGSIFFVGLCIFLYIYFCRRLPAINNIKLIASVNPDYAGVAYNQDDWEVPRENILQLHELGQGSFGMVYEGIIKNLKTPNDETRCAIKTVNENATDKERGSFLKEADVMKQFDTNHVVHLLGVVSQGQPTLVIMELMANGDLKGYLRSHRPDYESSDNPNPPQPPTLRRILQMAIEIADGMAYLSAKKFVHRDLAARNCMVAEDLTVKIGDFGMTRDIYETDYYRKGTKGLLPVRWMSPESLKDGVFTSSSDVFSYGVVLWEMATLASQPYQGLSNDQVLRYVIDGGVMERPENCPDKLYDLMRRCWQHRPTSRPTFMDIISMLLVDAQSNFSAVSFYHSPAGHDFNQQNSVQVPIDDVTTPLRQGEEGNSSVDGNEEYNALMVRNDSHLVQDNGPLPTIISTHSPLRMGIGSGNFIDSTVISFASENDANENNSDSPSLMSIDDFGRSCKNNKLMDFNNKKFQQQNYNLENDIKKLKLNGYNGMSLANFLAPGTIDNSANMLTGMGTTVTPTPSMATNATGTPNTGPQHSLGTSFNDQNNMLYNHHNNVANHHKGDFYVTDLAESNGDEYEDDDDEHERDDDNNTEEDNNVQDDHDNDVDGDDDDYDNEHGGNTFKLKLYRHPNNANAYTKMNKNKKKKLKKSIADDELRPPKNRNGFLMKK